MDSKIHNAQLDAFKSVGRAKAALDARLEAALAADDLPPLSWYDVLCALDDAPDRSLRPRDLAYDVALTRSGLTRLLDRIYAAGLVERRECPSDRRGHLVVLTKSGEETLKLMRPVYARELHAGFASLVTREEAEQLHGVLGRVTSSACSVVGEDDQPAEAA